MTTFTFPTNPIGGGLRWVDDGSASFDPITRTASTAISNADIMAAFIAARAAERSFTNGRVYGLLEHNPTDALVNVHTPDRCAKQTFCPIHRRSVHPYRGWKQVWERSKTGGRGYMRRVCEHGRWVVDPDEKFKPEFATLLEQGWQDCARCNPNYRTFLQEQHTRISDHLATVGEYLEAGDFGRAVEVGEQLPGGAMRTLEFFPDEAVLYFGMNLAEIEHELGGG